MKETLTYLLGHIVNHTEDIQVDEVPDEDRTILTIHVHKDDMGKVIGKQGRIIRAIRDLIKLMATKRNLFVDVVLAES